MKATNWQHSRLTIKEHKKIAKAKNMYKSQAARKRHYPCYSNNRTKI